MNIVCPESLAVWANDFSSSPNRVCPVLVTADLKAGTTFLVLL